MRLRLRCSFLQRRLCDALAAPADRLERRLGDCLGRRRRGGHRRHLRWPLLSGHDCDDDGDVILLAAAELAQPKLAFPEASPKQLLPPREVEPGKQDGGGGGRK
eukprot:362294-Chlamydomonas_euryale.AAC.2